MTQTGDQPLVDQVLKTAGGRESRMRFAFADAFRAAGDQARAAAVLKPLGNAAGRAGERVLQGKSGGISIDNSRRAFAEMLIVLAAELNRLRNEKMPIALSQVAHYAAPESSAASVMLGLMLARRDWVNEALAALRSVPADDPLWSAPNVLISPHYAGSGNPRNIARLADGVAETLRRFRAGEPLLHVVSAA